jgi:hypothetical protein
MQTARRVAEARPFARPADGAARNDADARPFARPADGAARNDADASPPAPPAEWARAFHVKRFDGCDSSVSRETLSQPQLAG